MKKRGMRLIANMARFLSATNQVTPRNAAELPLWGQEVIGTAGNDSLTAPNGYACSLFGLEGDGEANQPICQEVA